LGVELLTTKSPERAASLADYIHQLNGSRETLERSVLLAAQKQIKEQCDPDGDPALILDGTGWHAGVIGIVAGRLAERYYRPVIMISWDQLGTKPGVGSARSAAGVNLHQALAACSDHLVAHGGHAQAAGLKIERSKLDVFRSAFYEHAASEMSEEDRTPEVRIDAETTFSQMTLNTMQQIEQLAPFGQSNPRPVLCASGVALASPPKRMGGGDRHLTVRLQQHGVAIRAVAFGRGEAADELARLDGLLDVAFRPVINEYRGRRSVEMHLVDWRASQIPALTTR
jgi:single-stranded-DNA-specific exonuclease